MVTLPDNLKRCGVKVVVTVAGVPVFGSGVIYVTPDDKNYNYVLTAKHLFQEDSQTDFCVRKISNIDVQYSEQDSFKRLVQFKKAEIQKQLIVFKADFAIIVIPKRSDLFFPSFLVADKLGDSTHFFSWATFKGNESKLHLFKFERNDAESRRFQTTKTFDTKYLPGLSGAGIFCSDRSVMVGVISNYPNEEFQNNTIDCSLITIEEINDVLIHNKLTALEAEGSNKKKIVDNAVVYIHQAQINGAFLDLEGARRRLEKDLEDDWFYDPLRYIDLLQPEYLFTQFKPYFGNDTYKTFEAERFYVPKRQYTLRQALVSPFIDRVVYMACVTALADKMDKAMIPTVYSARYNRFSDKFLILKGVEQWKKMQYQLFETAKEKDTHGNYLYNCVIEVDLFNFYDNIDMDLLHEKVMRVCETENDRMVGKLLNCVIRDFSPRKNHGLPQNCDASSLLASFYLNQVDIFMSHHCPVYYRFMDDIRIFCVDKYKARKLLQTLEYELRRCHLSVNSQKTKICTFQEEEVEEGSTDKKQRQMYGCGFDVALSQIAAYRRSLNYVFRNEAFHLSVTLLKEGMDESDPFSSDEIAKRINFSLSTLCQLARKGLALTTKDFRLETALESAINALKDKPWITPQLCNVLSLVSSEVFEVRYLPGIKEVLLDERYNTYAFQVYLLWLLLAKHKCFSQDIIEYAVQNIEKNDDTNKPVIAGMLIYVCSVNIEYRRIVIRKLEEGFTNGYFQNRIALITLRKFPSELLHRVCTHPSLKESHLFTHKFKDRDLVFVPGFVENEEDMDDETEDQLYSL